MLDPEIDDACRANPERLVSIPAAYIPAIRRALLGAYHEALPRAEEYQHRAADCGDHSDKARTYMAQADRFLAIAEEARAARAQVCEGVVQALDINPETTE